MDLGSKVNRQQMTGNAAYDCIWATYPQLSRQNLGTLLRQAFVSTR